MIHAVMGLIINKDGLILIAQRGEHQPQAGTWELPGGKVEPGETAWAALQREFKEEIGIEIIQAKPWVKIPDNENKDIFLDIWIIEQFSGDILGLEGQSLYWVNRDQLISFFDFPNNETGRVGDMLDNILKNRTLCDDDMNF